MPQGNAHELPHGIWWTDPTTSSYKRLLLRSAARFAGFAFVWYCIFEYRSLAYKYTYTQFIGKTMTLGSSIKLNHEPLSVEEIDKLKEAEAIRKKARLTN